MNKDNPYRGPIIHQNGQYKYHCMINGEFKWFQGHEEIYFDNIRCMIEEMISYLEKRGIKEFCLDSGYKDAQKRWCRKFGNPYKIVKDYWGTGIDNMVWICKI